MNKLKELILHSLGFSFIEDDPLDERATQRRRATLLCSVLLGLMAIGIGISVLEGNGFMTLPLGFMVTVAVGGLVWVKSGGDGRYSLFAVSGAILALGAYLLLVRNVPGGGGLFWILLFPPILMVCLGLRHGTLFFGIFYLFLLVAFLSPAYRFLSEEHSLPVRLRFLGAMLGIFIFSWLAEYARMHAYRALLSAIVKLERDSLTDALTGLGNRRDFYTSFAWARASAVRSNDPLSIAFVDIDHFKKVNDRYGHNVGDDVLRHLSKTLAGALRSTDRLFRWGGEELIVLMPKTGIEEARTVSERLRGTVEKTPHLHNGAPIPLTISLGVFCGPSDQDVDTVVDQADRNLYEAKSRGRNQVCG